jgi:signal transduction histidine kinase
MYKDGVLMNQRTAKAMRFAGFLLPAALFGYGFLVKNEVVDASHYTGDIALYLITIPWFFLGCLQFLLPSKTRFDFAWRFIGFHGFAALYVFFVAGLNTPFTAGWVLLFLAAYATFSGIGLRLSVAIFAATAVIDSLLHWQTPTVLLVNLLWLFVILIVGITCSVIVRIQEIDEAELMRSKAQQTLQRDRILTLVNNLTDAILSTDNQGVIRLYNAASLNLLDTNKSLNGIHIDDALSLHIANKEPFKLSESLRTTQSVVVRDDLTMAIGDEVYRLEVTYSPIRSSYSRSKKAEAQDGYILILRDVTKAKSLEEERDEFISVVSHELRTPITVAEGTISNVQVMMERKDFPPETLKSGIASAHEQVMYLAKMVNDLSTLSRAERGVADAPETIKVRELIDELYREYAPQAEAKGLKFNLDLAPYLGKVSASPLYLKEMLQNFITNAIKYTKEGSVSVHVTRDKAKNKVTFEVKDTGIGISKSDQAKIFNKFYRAEDYRTRETSGTGLGLYVTTKLAKKIGTKIDFHSRLNHGSSFSFSLKSTGTTNDKDASSN